MEQSIENTVEHNENNVPGTDSDNNTGTEQSVTEAKSDNTTPSVEMRDGKTYVNGVRVYTRDDTNKIAANAKNETESRLLAELNVDSIDSVKQVVSTLQDSSSDEGQSLNVNSLRDAVKKREATVEELRAQVTGLKTDLLLKDHMGQLNNAMPSNWNATQKEAVIKLMKADNMLAVEGDTFAIRDGNDFLTVDGERPDYEAAVKKVGTNLGLSFGKKGVDIQYQGDTSSATNSSNKAANADKILHDTEYRTAYMKLRQSNPNAGRDSFSDSDIKSMIKKKQ